MSRRLSHSDYYCDRQSEYELCRDFPADEPLIDGLHAMQTHFMRRGMAIEIPVVRIMNTAHWLACYMFATTCSGDQMEYDVLTYDSVGQDKKLAVISLIVLASMLKRTEGMRARSCRSVLLEDRSEDFYDGLSLYEQFLENGEARFSQEDFENDIMREIQHRDEIIEQQVSQIISLQNTINTMNQQNIQYKQDNNQGTIYNAPVYITYAAAQPQNQPEQAPAEETTVSDIFCHITRKCINEKRVEAVEAEIRAACKGTAEGLWRTLWNNENLGYVEVEHIDATTLYKDIENRFGKLPFKERQFRSARNKR